MPWYTSPRLNQNTSRRKPLRPTYLLLTAILLTIPATAQQPAPPPQPAPKPLFTLQEVMIPVRDGVHLQTVILTPVTQPAITPPRSPSSSAARPTEFPTSAPEQMPPFMKELAQDGYIFVIQNLRGRFKSEGVFNLSSQVDLTDPKATNETTDAYDTIEWLVKNVPNNNGKVGIYGVSYDGLTAALTLLHPHPALKAISEQASPVDQWMNDDDHRYGALRESYDFEYAVMEQADKNENTHFDFRDLRHLPVVSRSRPALEHQRQISPRLHSVLEFHRRASQLRRLLEKRSVGQPAPRLNRAQSKRRRILGSGRSLGTVADFPSRRRKRPGAHQLHGRRPLVSRRVASPKGDTIGPIPFGGHETAREFRENIEAPFFRYYLHGKGEKPAWQGQHFSKRIKHLAYLRCVAAERSQAHKTLFARRRHAVFFRASLRA